MVVEDNYLERFAKKQNIKIKSVDWIKKSINKISFNKGLVNNNGDVKVIGFELSGVHIFKEREGPDNGILYTYRTDGLSTGDIIVKRSLNKNQIENEENQEVFILFEETPRVDGSADIKVFSTIEVNAIVKAKDETYFAAYFKGEMRRESLLEYSAKVNLAATDMVALLIVPVKQRVVLHSDVFTRIKSLRGAVTNYNVSWQVEDKDDLTTADMQYVSLRKTLREPITETSPIEPEKPVLPTIAAGTTQQVSTYGAYFAASRSVKVIKRQAELITFEAPSTVGELVITTRNSLGQDVPTTYLVVI